MMRNKTRFIQREYSIDLDTKSDYLLVVEIVEGVPTASYTVVIPTRNTRFLHLSQFQN